MLLGPLNAVLAMIGLVLDQWLGILAGVLAIGPLLLKMMIGHDFKDFRIEARRGDRTGNADAAPKKEAAQSAAGTA
jgi:hypothetical protein